VGFRGLPDNVGKHVEPSAVRHSNRDCLTPCVACAFWRPPRALRGGISKSIFQRRCQYLAINAHKMAPRTGRWLQERGRDAPT
jgi:hypothetical protein